MKTKIMVVILFVGVICLVGFDSNQTNPLEGNWELVSAKGTYVADGKPVSVDLVNDTNNFGMVMIHDGYFMFVTKFMIDGEIGGAKGYGTYTYVDNICTVKYIYISEEEFIGKSISTETTVSGDTLIQKGPLEDDTGMQFVETYVRRSQ